MRRVLLFLFVFLSCLVIISFNINCSSNNSNTEELSYKNHADDVKYVGMQTCKTCHQNIYDSFIKTGMGKSFGAATKEKSAAHFSEHTKIYDPYLNFYYHPYFQNDSLYILEYRLENGDTTHKRIEKVEYIVGSGQHTNSHMYQTNGYFYQMPMTYYTQIGKWDFPPGFENGHNSRFSRTIELECMSCHNAYPNFVVGSKNKYASVLQGIDCERCHGPGEIHVKEKSQGIIVDTSKEIDYSIVNPGKLSYELQVDVCQRCHLQGNAVLKEGKSFFDFKPGQKLSDFMNVFLPRYEGDHSFIMASHADRLKQSECFIKSNEENRSTLKLTCINCHNPHLSVKETKDIQFNNACMSCHNTNNTIKLNECNLDIKKRMSINQNNCWKCHMPSTGTEDIPHVSIHDHKIQIPIDNKEKSSIKKFVGLAAINNKNVDAHTKGEAYLSYYEKFDNKSIYLDSAMYYLNQKGTYSDVHLFNNKIRLFYLKNDFRKVIDLAENQATMYSKDAWTLYRISEAYNTLNNIEKASLFAKASVERAPYNLEFRNKLAALYVQSNKLDEAINEYQFILKENHKFVPALSNLGFIYMQNGKMLESYNLITKAIKLDPDYEQALFNLAGWYMANNNVQETKKILRRIIEINPKNIKAINALNTL